MRLHGFGLWRLPTLVVDLVSVDIQHHAIVLDREGIEGNKEILFHRAIHHNGVAADLFDRANLFTILAVHFHQAIELQNARTMPLLLAQSTPPGITCKQLSRMAVAVCIAQGGQSRPVFNILPARRRAAFQATDTG